MVIYKIVLKNGKEYVIRDKENNVVKFIERLVKPNSFNDYLLAEDLFEKGVKYNTIMINSNEVSSVEYLTNEE